jgi:hypothetical protein
MVNHSRRECLGVVSSLRNFHNPLQLGRTVPQTKPLYLDQLLRLHNRQWCPLSLPPRLPKCAKQKPRQTVSLDHGLSNGRGSSAAIGGVTQIRKETLLELSGHEVHVGMRMSRLIYFPL